VNAFAVFNPAANHGQVGRDWGGFGAALRTVFPDLVATASGGRGQAARLVRDALREDHGEIIVVGGDGTINEGVNGFFDQGVPVAPDAVLSIVPAGAGGDIGHGMQTGVAAALRLAHARVRTVDLGHVSCLTPDGNAAARFFLGAASFGLTADIARRLNRSRFLPWRRVQGILARAAWAPAHVRLMAEGGHDEIDGITAVAVLNGPHFGGGLKAAPAADNGDGVFEIAVLAGAPKPRLGPMLQGLRNGEPPDELRLLRTTRLTATPVMETGKPVWVETDGEALGILPATFQIAPRVLRLRA